MIDDVDTALRSLLTPQASEHGAEVSLEAPTREWSARLSQPTLDAYLFDIREDVDLRSVAREAVIEDNVRVARAFPPRFYRLSYLLTAWTARPEDEHRILADALSVLSVLDVIPQGSLSGWLAEQPRAVRLEVALPLAEDRAMSDLWTALGGEFRLSVEVVVTAPLRVLREESALAPLVQQRTVTAKPWPGHGAEKGARP